MQGLREDGDVVLSRHEGLLSRHEGLLPSQEGQLSCLEGLQQCLDRLPPQVPIPVILLLGFASFCKGHSIEFLDRETPHQHGFRDCGPL